MASFLHINVWGSSARQGFHEFNPLPSEKYLSAWSYPHHQFLQDTHFKWKQKVGLQFKKNVRFWFDISDLKLISTSMSSFILYAPIAREYQKGRDSQNMYECVRLLHKCACIPVEARG